MESLVTAATSLPFKLFDTNVPFDRILICAILATPQVERLKSWIPNFFPTMPSPLPEPLQFYRVFQATVFLLG
jgi:hypothetical protein